MEFFQDEAYIGWLDQLAENDYVIIDDFISEIINGLDLNGKVKHIYFDFQGARQQGSDRLWFAIFNNKTWLRAKNENTL